jgi:pSer/pThr/pTyr-binding forkhead associated (FHA) protein
MPQCLKCNADYIAGELFCPACGQALPAPTLWPPRAPAPPSQEPEARKKAPANHKGEEAIQPEINNSKEAVQPEANNSKEAAQPEANNSKEAAQPEATSNGPVKPAHLRLRMPSGMIIDLQGRETALIGRKDVDVTPDVDLVPYGALEKGVSRKHAMILFDDGRYYIQDMESTNYTLLNNARLFPRQLYPLKHDDQLTLGDLEIRVLL